MIEWSDWEEVPNWVCLGGGSYKKRHGFDAKTGISYCETKRAFTMTSEEMNEVFEFVKNLPSDLFDK